MICGHATIQTAVEATQLGAYDILEKPLDTDRILRRCSATRSGTLDLPEENARLRETIAVALRDRGAVVRDPRAAWTQIDKVAGTPARVLITGRERHRQGARRARDPPRGRTRAQGPFVEVNCAAIPAELIESELFGHVKGSFTGAVQDRAGQVRAGRRRHALPRRDRRHGPRGAGQGAARAAGGRGHAHRRAASRCKVDVRVIAATNKDLEEEIAEGRFREDLYYRLNVVPIVVPPLRERREDIAPAGAALPRAARRRATGCRAAASATRRSTRLAAARVAGQRARAPQHGGAARDPRRGPRIAVADVERLVGARAVRARRASGSLADVPARSRSSRTRPSAPSCSAKLRASSTGTCRRRRARWRCRAPTCTRRSSGTGSTRA